MLGQSRKAVIEGLREIYRLAVKYERDCDPTFRRWPDMETILDHIEQHGLPPNVKGEPRARSERTTP